jgi:hypothetical protein
MTKNPVHPKMMAWKFVSAEVLDDAWVLDDVENE